MYEKRQAVLRTLNKERHLEPRLWDLDWLSQQRENGYPFVRQLHRGSRLEAGQLRPSRLEAPTKDFPEHTQNLVRLDVITVQTSPIRSQTCNQIKAAKYRPVKYLSIYLIFSPIGNEPDQQYRDSTKIQPLTRHEAGDMNMPKAFNHLLPSRCCKKKIPCSGWVPWATPQSSSLMTFSCWAIRTNAK